MSDLRPLTSSLSKLTSETFSKKFVALGRILNAWDDIIGSELAVKAQPVKIRYRKPKDAKEKPSATLEIATSSADATVLHYQKDLILARINRIFGDNWVTEIRFVHIPAGQDNENGTLRRGFALPPKPLSGNEKERIDSLLSDVEDEDLRARLKRLGESVLRKETTEKKR